MRALLAIIGWLLLPLVLRLLVGQLYRILSAWIDRRHPDDLPLHAGAWAAEQIERLKLPVRVLPGPKRERSYNHYVPAARVVILSQLTYYKPDPGAWATAAHEVGHAMFHADWPRLGRFLLAVHLLPRRLWDAAFVLVVANLLYGSADVNRVILGLLVGAAVLSPLAIVEEARASRRALHLLDGDPRLERRGRRAARMELSAAYATYVADWLGQLGAIALFGQIRLILEARHFVAAAPLQGFKLLLCAAATAAVAARLAQLARGLRPLRVLWDLPVLALVALLWNQPRMMASSLLAALSMTRLVGLLFAPFVMAGALLVVYVMPKARPEKSRPLLANLARATPEIVGAASDVARAHDLAAADVRLPVLLSHLLILPMLLQFWLQRLL